MSIKTQEAHMKRLAELLSMDLTYIWGRKESGPNGEKAEFLRKGKTFLRALAKDLGFVEYHVIDSPGGIGVSGDVFLDGMWSEGNGIHVMLSPASVKDACVLYRSITKLHGGSSGFNQWLSLSWFRSADYASLCGVLRRMKKEAAANGTASAA